MRSTAESREWKLLSLATALMLGMLPVNEDYIKLLLQLLSAESLAKGSPYTQK